MNITMTGNLGSGKTSVCKEFQKLGYEIISTGNIFREIAAEKGITVVELNELAKKDRSIDDMIDNRTVKLGTERDNCIFDSRLAWHFVPESFKVFLLVNVNEAARRVFTGDARAAEEYSTLEEAAASLRKRAELEQARFKELYGINYYDLSNYDLVIESTNATPKEIACEIISNFKEYTEKKYSTRLLLNAYGDESPFGKVSAKELRADARAVYMADFGGL